MKQRFLLTVVLVFLMGMFAQNMLSDFFSKEIKAEMAVEEISAANNNTANEDAYSNSIFNYNEGNQPEMYLMDSKDVLKTVVELVSADKGVLSIKHDDFNVEYIVNERLNKDIVVYCNKDFKYIKRKEEFRNSPFYYLISCLPYGVVELANQYIYTNFEKQFKTDFISARARSPGEAVDVPFQVRLNAIKPIQKNTLKARYLP